MTKINNPLGNNLYCKISDNPYSFADWSENSKDLFDELLPDIEKECNEKLYSDYETEIVLSHYKIAFDNYSGTWGKELGNI